MGSNIFCHGGLSAGSCGCAPTSPRYSVSRLNFRLARARVVAVGGDRNGGQIIFSVRQREAVAERAVGTQFDFVSAEGDLGPRFGRAVND